MTILSILKKVPLFCNIGEKDLKKIEGILKEKYYKKNDHIFLETDKGSEFYIVYGGRIKIYKMSAEGQVKALDYLEKGDFFGEMALIDSSPRSANALAVEDTTLLSVSCCDFEKFLIENPDILLTITRTICQRLRKADQEIEMFSFSNVKDRLILCFINLAEKYGEETSDGIKVPGLFTHKDLSELIGTAREVVTRLIKELKEEKLITSQGKDYVIPSIPGLKKKIAE